MSTNSGIEWTEATWNPVVGCAPVSPGCLNCYAATMAHRLACMGQERYYGLTVYKGGRVNPDDERQRAGGRDVFNGVVRCLDDVLTKPLSWRKPRMIFVNSMSDLFHEAVPFEFIDRCFAVMALCPHHTFQVLTKRPERMAEYLSDPDRGEKWWDAIPGRNDWEKRDRQEAARARLLRDVLPNVWLGTSTENQKAADERIPHLLRCPASVRFLSCEPLLGPVDLAQSMHEQGCNRCGGTWDGADPRCPQCSHFDPMALSTHERVGVDWVIVGGESGANARPCDVAWIRSIVAQCKAAGVPVFVKQLGANVVYGNGRPIGERREIYPGGPVLTNAAMKCDWFRDRKGGDPSEWPEDLRVREFPEVSR